MFSTVGMKRSDAHRWLQLRDCTHRADHRRAAAHVVFHLLHAVGRLDGDAAGIERDTFSDQAQVVRRRGVFRDVAKHDQTPGGCRCPAPPRAAIPFRAAAFGASSRTSHSRPDLRGHLSRPVPPARSGVSRLAGSFFSSRLKFCASAMMRPRRLASAKLGRSLRPPQCVNDSIAFRPSWVCLQLIGLEIAEDRALHGSLRQLRLFQPEVRCAAATCPLSVRTAVADSLSHLGSPNLSRLPAPASTRRLP